MRITKKKLRKLIQKLNKRDLDTLSMLCKYRFMSTDQVRRMLFIGYENKAAVLRTSTRVLDKLRKYGLVINAKRRIGGRWAGSGAFVWRLSPLGSALVNFCEKPKENIPRKRVLNPSRKTLVRAMVLAEVAIRIHELANSDSISVKEEIIGFDCWRKYSDVFNASGTLKPGMYLVTSSGEYEDRWFLEFDCLTERPCAIRNKCVQYMDYYRTGVEQHMHGIFPCVVWVVPDEKRRETIERCIDECWIIREKRLFVFVGADDLELLIQKGVDDFRKKQRCKSVNGL